MDSEGIRETMMVTLHLMELLEKIFGFSIQKTGKAVGITGQGIGKGIRYVYSLYNSGRMLEGGERTFQQIVRNKGSLDMAVTTVHIEDWNSKEGLAFRKYLDNRNVQYVLLDDVTKGDNKVQFMYHASDAEKINSILRDYQKVKNVEYEDAVPMSDAYDTLSAEQKSEVNRQFEERALDVSIPAYQNEVPSVYAQIGQAEKKRDYVQSVRQEVFEEIMIPEQYVKLDADRNIAFVRCGEKGYVIPMSQIQQAYVGNRHGDGQTDIKVRCRISKTGRYLEFHKGVPRTIRGEELMKELKKLGNNLQRTEHHMKNRTKVLEMKGKKR